MSVTLPNSTYLASLGVSDSIFDPIDAPSGTIAGDFAIGGNLSVKGSETIQGNLTVVGTINGGGSGVSISDIVLDQGTVANPSLGFSTQLGETAGLYQPAVNQLAITCNGQQVVLLRDVLVSIQKAIETNAAFTAKSTATFDATVTVTGLTTANGGVILNGSVTVNPTGTATVNGALKSTSFETTAGAIIGTTATVNGTFNAKALSVLGVSGGNNVNADDGVLAINKGTTGITITPGVRQTTPTANTVTYDIGGNGVHYFWDNLETSGTLIAAGLASLNGSVATTYLTTSATAAPTVQGMTVGWNSGTGRSQFFNHRGNNIIANAGFEWRTYSGAGALEGLPMQLKADGTLIVAGQLQPNSISTSGNISAGSITVTTGNITVTLGNVVISAGTLNVAGLTTVADIVAAAIQGATLNVPGLCYLGCIPDPVIPLTVVLTGIVNLGVTFVYGLLTAIGAVTVAGLFTANGGTVLNGGNQINGINTITGFTSSGDMLLNKTTNPQVSINAGSGWTNSFSIATAAAAYSTTAAAGDTVIRANGGRILMQSGSGAAAVVINSSGAVTIPGTLNTGTLSPSSISTAGNLSVTNFTAPTTAGAYLGYNTANGRTLFNNHRGTQNINNGWEWRSYSLSGTLDFTAMTLTANGSLAVTAAISTGGNLVVTGTATVSSNLNLAGDLVLVKTTNPSVQVSANGTNVLSAGVATAANAFATGSAINDGIIRIVGGGSLFLQTGAGAPAIVIDASNVTTVSSLTVSGSSSLTGNLTVGGTLTVTGAASLNGSATATFLRSTSTAVPTTAGTTVGYNTGTGQTQFFNHRGALTGGFEWRVYSGAGTLDNTPMTLAPGGNLTCGPFQATSIRATADIRAETNLRWLSSGATLSTYANSLTAFKWDLYTSQTNDIMFSVIDGTGIRVAGGTTTTYGANALAINPGYRQNVLTANYCQYELPGTGTHFFWDNVEVDNNLTINGNILGNLRIGSAGTLFDETGVNGDLVINTTSTSKFIKLRVNGTEIAVIKNTGTDISGNLTVTGSAAKPGGGSWSTLSDRRLKKNIANYVPGLKEINKLQPVTFEYNGLSASAPANGITYVGMVAQDAQAVVPNMVQTMPDGYMALDNSELVYTLMNAVKELSARVVQLESSVLALNLKRPFSAI